LVRAALWLRDRVGRAGANDAMRQKAPAIPERSPRAINAAPE
jgi:hypothetical protein